MNEVAIRTELLARLERAAEQREQTRELRKLQAAGSVPHLKTWLTHLTDAAALRSAATAELLLGRGAAAREAFAEAARASRAAIE